jgi:uncharacterized protein (DUF1778 family)
MSETVTDARSRVTTRIPDRMRETLEQAAEIVGAPLNQFIVQTAFAEAQRIVERETVIRLSQEGAKRIIALMENPPKPNERLLAAAKLFKETVRVQD